jgi:hypothetical protein
MLGLYVTLSGTNVNAGTYRIATILSTTAVKLVSCFYLPDPDNTDISWEVFDPRNGQIAERADDVTVLINNVQVIPEQVNGLLGQIILTNPPNPGDDVKVSYSWIENPTVDFRSLNSPAFRLNSWNRDVGYADDGTGHKYRYNNQLIVPSNYVPSNSQSTLPQPQQRDLKYRAYERAYTAVLNDPNLLVLNSPLHKIAYPPLSREVTSTFVSYGATALPENDPIAPWDRTGTGTTSIANSLLTVTKTVAGPFPNGRVLFWTRQVDLTFQHVFAATWRNYITIATTTEGVFTGIAAGYSDSSKAIVLGYLTSGGVNQIGLLVSGGGNDPSVITAWSGGISNGSPTGSPATLDWTVIHSYRLFRDPSGNISVYLDGDVTPTLQVLESQLPALEELTAPFNQLQGVFFGSMSYESVNTSLWDFVKYDIIPTNPLQTAPSVFVSYEGTTTPEAASQPWTPIGYAGTETLLSTALAKSLIIDSTSATTTSVESQVGLIGGDFRGYDRIEPLLSISSDVVLDVSVQLRTFTHGISPNSVMAAIDDGNRVIQLCFFPDQSSPLFSYGGRTLPTQFQPYTWSSMGSQTGAMYGRTLRITDSSSSDGLLYYIDDTAPPTASNRVVGAANDYILEFRVLVRAFTVDPGPTSFCGVNADIYDGARSLGVMLTQFSGVPNVTLHSDGVAVQSFPFDWNDGNEHTYRMVKSTSGNLVSLFIDTVYIGSTTYANFSAPGAGLVGVISFGSTTPASLASTSTVDWIYCNAWRVLSSFSKFVGIWKGTDPNSLTGYYLPVSATGSGARVVGNALEDLSANFTEAEVQVGDSLIVDAGSNKGVYTVASVAQNVLTFTTVFPAQPSTVDYRIAIQVDWTQNHRYRIVRDPSGGISVLLDTTATPLIRAGYSNVPQSLLGVPRVINGALPSIVFGAFDPTNISQTAWNFVRYGITSSPSATRIVPPHQNLNQRNVIASPEHLFTNIPHTHTDFWSSSTGIPPEIAPDFLENPGLIAFTLLNEGTPLVPQTQTFEVRRPTVVNVPVAGLNTPGEVLNSQAFTLNNSEYKTTLVVPNDVLYNSLQVIEHDTGVTGLIAPFKDHVKSFDTITLQNEVCLTYDASTLPEDDTTSASPWSFEADDPSFVTKTTFSGTLTYGTTGSTRTSYSNRTPLLNSTGLITQVTYTLKLLADATFGLGDTQVRFGITSSGVSLALGFVTLPSGERYVLVFDQNSGQVVGGRRFDFLDGNSHQYRLLRDPTKGTFSVFIDS